MNRIDSISPVRVLLLVIVVVFATEVAIMGALSTIDTPSYSSAAISLLDALVLVAILSPLLWHLVVRPLRATIAARGALLARTLSIQEEERARLSRDLHDELGQSLTAVLLGIRGAAMAPTLELARARADEAASMAGEVLESARRLAHGLSPSVLHDLGLAASVARVGEDLATAETAIESQISIGSERFDSQTEITLYRVAQEALTNAVKHARARRIRLELSRVEDRLRLVIEDDGRGMGDPGSGTPSNSGLGTAAMQERIMLLGGTFQVTSATGRGTRISAEVPATPGVAR